MTDNEKIAMLTTGALKTTMESAVKAMMAAVEAAEEKTKELRAATEESTGSEKVIQPDPITLTAQKHPPGQLLTRSKGTT